MALNKKKTKKKKKTPLTKTLVNIATIISTSVTCISLVFRKVIPIQIALVIMVGTAVFVALGNTLSKIVLACTALFLFVLYYSNGNTNHFSALMKEMVTLILVMLCVYILVRSFFKK